MMEIKSLDARYDYDSRVDVVNIEVKKEYVYEISLDLEVGVFLHFDKNYFPVGIEIMDASKKIGVDKDFLISPSGSVRIVKKDDFINVEITFVNNDENELLQLNTIGESFIPDVETGFALV